MSEFDAARPELRANVVNVTVPVKVFHDLDAIQEVQRKVLDQLGCRACCSGWDIRFDVARQFLVDERLNVRTINQIEQLEQ